MPTQVLERPIEVESPTVKETITIIQEHLDKEAKNRRQSVLAPKDLCPMQKSELLEDLRIVLR